MYMSAFGTDVRPVLKRVGNEHGHNARPPLCHSLQRQCKARRILFPVTRLVHDQTGG